MTLASYGGNDIRAAATRFSDQSGIAVRIHPVESGLFSDVIESYLQATPDDVFPAFAGFELRRLAERGLVAPIDDVWARVGANFGDSFKAAATGPDGHQYLIPVYDYPWAVFYRTSVFSKQGYSVPTTWAEFKALSSQMRSDGLIPLAMGSKELFPVMGLFDILDLRVNGYQFHLDLLEGNESWLDPRVKTVFERWRELSPFIQDAAAGRQFRAAAETFLAGEAGMYFFGTFVWDGFSADARTDDLDLFPFPSLGTEWDPENAIEAPIDGFAVARMAADVMRDPSGTNAFMEFLARGSTQQGLITDTNVAAAKDVDTSGYGSIQKRSAALINRAGRITQFLDRDTDSAFAQTVASDGLLPFLRDSSMDLDVMLRTIQGHWDAR